MLVIETDFIWNVVKRQNSNRWCAFPYINKINHHAIALTPEILVKSIKRKWKEAVAKHEALNVFHPGCLMYYTMGSIKSVWGSEVTFIIGELTTQCIFLSHDRLNLFVWLLTCKWVSTQLIWNNEHYIHAFIYIFYFKRHLFCGLDQLLATFLKRHLTVMEMRVKGQGEESLQKTWLVQ